MEQSILGCGKALTIVFIAQGTVAMSKLIQGAAQPAKSAPKGAPRKVHQGAAQNTSKSAPKRPHFYEKGAPKGAQMAFNFLNSKM